MNPVPTLRPATRNDIPAMMALFHASVHEVAAGDYNQAQRDAWAPDSGEPARWEKRLAEQQVWIAETDGAMSGFCAWTIDGYLDLLFVHPNHTRQGVATALCAKAEYDLRSRGVQRVHTQASITAQPFFNRHGFRLVRHQVVRTRDVSPPNAIMEKPLG